MLDSRSEEQASLYVLGILEPDEAQAFRARLKREPELAKLVRDLEDTTATIAMDAPPMVPPAGNLEGIFDRIHEEESAKVIAFPSFGKGTALWAATAVGWAAAACLAIVLFLDLGGPGETGDGRELASNETAPAVEVDGERFTADEVETLIEQLDSLESDFDQLTTDNITLLADYDTSQERIQNLETLVDSVGELLDLEVDTRDPESMRVFAAALNELYRDSGSGSLDMTQNRYSLYVGGGSSGSDGSNLRFLPMDHVAFQGDTPESAWRLISPYVSDSGPGSGTAGINRETGLPRSGALIDPVNNEVTAFFPPPEDMAPNEIAVIWGATTDGEIIPVGVPNLSSSTGGDSLVYWRKLDEGSPQVAALFGTIERTTEEGGRPEMPTGRMFLGPQGSFESPEDSGGDSP